MQETYTKKKTIFLRYMNIGATIILKLITIDYQNNYVKTLKYDDNLLKSFDILLIFLSV